MIPLQELRPKAEDRAAFEAILNGTLPQYLTELGANLSKVSATSSFIHFENDELPGLSWTGTAAAYGSLETNRFILEKLRYEKWERYSLAAIVDSPPEVLGTASTFAAYRNDPKLLAYIIDKIPFGITPVDAQRSTVNNEVFGYKAFKHAIGTGGDPISATEGAQIAALAVELLQSKYSPDAAADALWFIIGDPGDPFEQHPFQLAAEIVPFYPELRDVMLKHEADLTYKSGRWNPALAWLRNLAKLYVKQHVQKQAHAKTS